MSSEVNHTERAHAVLSASGSSRWMNCTPSARLEEKYPSTSSIHADEGTLAHELAEHLLATLYRNADRSAEIAEIEKHPLYSSEMPKHVRAYCDYVLEQHATAKAEDPHAVLFTEIKLDLSKYVPEGFGTTDAAICSAGTIDVIDLKYGQGVRVSARDNAQLKLYALGVLEAFAFMYEAKKVRLHIHQPRLDAVSTFEIGVQELIEWGELEVKHKADMAIKGEGELKPGSWCGFCKARNRCRAMLKELEAIAVHDFSDPRELSDEELLDVYKRADLVSGWLNSVKGYMLSEAINGKSWDGLKVVAGRMTRTPPDPVKVAEVLAGAQFDREEYTKTELRSMTEIEKLLGKKTFEELLGPLVVKKSGRPALVDESDKRPPFDPAASAAADFEE